MIGSELPGVPQPIKSAIVASIKNLKNRPTALSLELSPETARVMQLLAEQMQTTPSDVISKALTLLLFTVEAKGEGFEVGIVRKENERYLETKITLE